MSKKDVVKKTPMVFESLKIERDRWGDKCIKGEAVFCSENGRIYFRVSEADARKILDLCADSLMNTTREMADVLRCDIIEGMSQIDNK